MKKLIIISTLLLFQSAMGHAQSNTELTACIGRCNATYGASYLSPSQDLERCRYQCRLANGLGVGFPSLNPRGISFEGSCQEQDQKIQSLIEIISELCNGRSCGDLEVELEKALEI